MVCSLNNLSVHPDWGCCLVKSLSKWYGYFSLRPPQVFSLNGVFPTVVQFTSLLRTVCLPRAREPSYHYVAVYQQQ